MYRRKLLGFLVAVTIAPSAAFAETFTVASQRVSDEKAVFATIESVSVVPARGRISGTIVQLGVREGNSVTRGQSIATIADEKLALQMKSLDAQIDALQAQSGQAQIDFTRTEGLVERGRFRVSNSTKCGQLSMWRKMRCGRGPPRDRLSSSNSCRYEPRHG